jgi:hypothetical protein
MVLAQKVKEMVGEEKRSLNAQLPLLAQSLFQGHHFLPEILLNVRWQKPLCVLEPVT